MEVATCNFSTKGKKPCGRAATAATGFCPIHTPLTGERVKCEFCGHLVKAHCRRHYNVCGVRRMPTLCYVRQGFNKFSATGDKTPPTERAATVRELQRRVVQLYESYAAPMLNAGGRVPPAPAPLQHSAKHRLQEAAICAIMRQHGMVAEGDSRGSANNRFYLDLGAGKGCLSKAVSAFNSAFPNSTYICVEKAAYKHKAEQTKYARTRRARVDLCDVDVFKLLQDSMGDYPSQDSFDGPAEQAALVQTDITVDVVGMGKHLCGSATDLALMSLKNMQTENLKNDNFSAEIKGICVAVCCHAASTWDCSAARPWLERQGIDEADFELIRHWSGYFTDSLLTEEHPFFDDARSERIVSSCTGHQTSADDLPGRALFGRMCKRVLDYGRVQFIRNELGLEARLCTYIGENVTPENVVLVAWPPA